MSKEFIKMVSELPFERFNAHVANLAEEKIPCGVFFGFSSGGAAEKIQWLRTAGINLSCVIVLADVQANALRKFVDVPVITLEDFPRLGEENFPAKPQEIFGTGILSDSAFIPFFARHGMDTLVYSDDGMFFFTMKNLPELYDTYELLVGEESKKVFCAAIKGRVTGKINDYRFAPEPQYFLRGFTPTAGDIAIEGVA